MKSAFKNLQRTKHSTDIGLLIAVTLCAVISTLLIYSIVRSGINTREGVGKSYMITQTVSMVIGMITAIII
ncbi:MAG: hypothetical protein IJM19_09345, partial [Ruminococcus sp.]|nr:hypothetical protein [Ruminococcus sp.]